MNDEPAICWAQAWQLRRPPDRDRPAPRPRRARPVEPGPAGPAQPGRGPRRKALADTLLAWLETRSIGQTAARLHIHRQTARYRMNQLQAMFGPALDDPDVRFELE
ncbi:MAG TPA: helix-turn-helix domain-containing protein, partial [Streptosporangiaceae bacterium]